MNENTRQVLERMEVARLELERKVLAELIAFESVWGIQVQGLALLRVDTTQIGALRNSSQLVQLTIECSV